MRSDAVGIIADVMLGFALTGLTNVHEEMLVSGRSGFIGAGGGIDSLPRSRQLDIQKKYPKWLQRLEKYPRHKVTCELLKNLRMAEAGGREIRIEAISRLLDILIAQGYAMDLDAFMASYVD